MICKNKSTSENQRFWNHVEAVAKEVRNREKQMAMTNDSTKEVSSSGARELIERAYRETCVRLSGWTPDERHVQAYTNAILSALEAFTAEQQAEIVANTKLLEAAHRVIAALRRELAAALSPSENPEAQ